MKTVEECVKYVEDHLVVKYATSNGAYISGRTIDPNGCVNHSLGVAQPSIDSIFSNMNQPSAGWGVNAILGDFHKGEGKIYLTLKMNSRPWGCGSGSKGSYNNSRIQWEVCEPAGHTYSGGTMIGYDLKKNQEYFDRMWKMLVAWNVYCMKKFSYKVSDICDHSESYKAGYGTNHADMMHWLPKHGKSMDALRAEVKAIVNGGNVDPENLDDLQATDLIDLSEAEVVEKVGPLFSKEQKRSGILGCVIFAQWILESGYGSTELALKGNNFFGMKEVLSGNTWPGTTWDGKSTITINTKEYYNGEWVTISAKFRKYPAVKYSIEDHSAYLLGAMNGALPRYAGLSGCTDYKKAAQIIKNGGYATDPNYVDKLVNIIERWDLTKYNYDGDPTPVEPEINTNFPATPFGVKVLIPDHPIVTAPGSNVLKGITGIGSFTIVKMSSDGYGLLKSYATNEDGWIDLRYADKCKILDTVPEPAPTPEPPKDQSFMVRVDIDGLRIRKKPSINSKFIGKYTGVGVFTIVKVKAGEGSKAGWGLLKSYAEKENGWISLDYATRI